MRRLLLLTLLAAAACPAAAHAAGPAYKPGEVVVRYSRAPAMKVVRLPRGESVTAAARRLRARPGVLSATPSYIARASAFVPDDPGDGEPGGWEALQWNFLPFVGVDAPDAWQHLIDVGRPGGKGVV